MPSKGGCCGEKAVVVNVYVERPRRRSDSNPSRREQQNHVIRRRLIHGRNINGGGYDRRALLLHYSQQLREAARSQLSLASTPSHPSSPSPPPSNCSQHAPLVPQPLANMAQYKRKYSRTPGCMGDCMSLLPKFLRSSAATEMKENSSQSTVRRKIVTSVKNFKVKEKWRSLLKFFPIRRKRSL